MWYESGRPQAELDAYLKGMRFVQVPVAVRAWESGASLVNWPV